MHLALVNCSYTDRWPATRLGKTATSTSFVEPSNQKFSIFDLVRLRDLCHTILGTTADIHDYDGLRRLPEFRRRVGTDLVRVF